ncbi:hypothetical protein [Streptomyces jumonjinensis]|uniref:hypothetical protein n=1 Tax=Streptomyces jumonjinensis TaxID=1945 RepID=UPI00379F8A20
MPFEADRVQTQSIAFLLKVVTSPTVRAWCIGQDASCQPKDCLSEAITGEGGEWNAQCSVAALHEIGHTVDEKRTRQILHNLAADGILRRLDTDRAGYRPADDPKQ